MSEEKPVNWVRAALGRPDAPRPPALDSERAKQLLRKALMQPTELQPAEVQELAAAAIAHLAALKAGEL